MPWNHVAPAADDVAIATAPALHEPTATVPA